MAFRLEVSFCVGSRWFEEAPRQIARGIHQTHRLQAITAHAVEDEQPVERPLDWKRAQALQLRMLKSPRPAQFRLGTKQSKRGVHCSFISSCDFPASLPH